MEIVSSSEAVITRRVRIMETSNRSSTNTWSDRHCLDSQSWPLPGTPPPKLACVAVAQWSQKGGTRNHCDDDADDRDEDENAIAIHLGCLISSSMYKLWKKFSKWSVFKATSLLGLFALCLRTFSSKQPPNFSKLKKSQSFWKTKLLIEFIEMVIHDCNYWLQ